MKNVWLIAVISIALGITSCSKEDDKEIVVYTVTFDTDGGSPVPATQKIEAGSTAIAPATNPTKTGYAFMYWYPNGANAAYNFQTPVNNNITLLAKWQEETTVQYWQVAWDLNGGTWPSDDNHATQVVKGGTLAEPAQPTKSDNTFDGWYKEAALTNKVSFPYSVSSVTSNFTLFAKWKENSGEEGEYRMFTSIAALSSWLASQPENTPETAYKVGLKNINLDNDNNWGDLGIAISNNKPKNISLDLQDCTGTEIPDGKMVNNNGTMTTYGVFINCDNLISINLPKSLKSIGKYAFYDCDGLISLTFPDGLKYIRERAFTRCDNLLTVNFSKELESIDKAAFRDCKALTAITFHDALRLIEYEAFFNCESLENLVLPKGLKDIREHAFSGSGIKSLVMNEPVTYINSHIFSGCTKLESVKLPEGLSVIGHYWFIECSSLASIQLPGSITEISQYAFKNCTALTKITVPSAVTLIGYETFAGCTSLSEIIMLPEAPPFFGTNALATTHNLQAIKVPAASVDAYKTATGWSGYASKIVAN